MLLSFASIIEDYDVVGIYSAQLELVNFCFVDVVLSRIGLLMWIYLDGKLWIMWDMIILKGWCYWENDMILYIDEWGYFEDSLQVGMVKFQRTLCRNLGLNPGSGVIVFFSSKLWT